VEIDYLDSDYVEQTEIVALNGVTAVPTVATDVLRVNGLRIERYGGNGVSSGNIDIRHVSDTPVYGRILAGDDSALQAFMTVPHGKIAYIAGWTAGNGDDCTVLFMLRSTSKDNVRTGLWYTHDVVCIRGGGQQVELAGMIVLPQYTDVKVTARSDVGGVDADVSATIEGWYE
jgi:hypothetical protein